MNQELKGNILAELKRDSARTKGFHNRTVIIHLTEDQYNFLNEQRRTYRYGLGWFIRRLLIIDMCRKRAKSNGDQRALQAGD